MRRRETKLANRRQMLRGFAAVALAHCSRPALAQLQTLRVVGVLSPSRDRHLQALLDGLTSRGWAFGRSIRVIERFGADNPEILQTLASDLVSQNVDVIVTVGYQATSAASKATKTTPVVMATGGSTQGLVANLAKPEQNITGLTLQQDETDSKLVSLLKEAVPAMSKLAILSSVERPPGVLEAARALAIDSVPVKVGRGHNFEEIFTDLLSNKPDGLFVVHNATFDGVIIRNIAFQALKHRLPSAASARGYAGAGFLLTYTANEPELRRRAAYYVDRLLKGTKPSDLPVEQPTKFELVINLKTANVLALAIPPALLARADEVIE